MSSKRRVFVEAFEGDSDDAGSNPKHRKKIVIAIDHNATNDDLSREIAAAVGNSKEDSNFVLELPGGFGLRGQDTIVDTVRDGELITARRLLIPSDSASIVDTIGPGCGSDDSVETPSLSDAQKPPHATPTNEPSRIQVRLISAELARNHAKVSLKEGSEHPNGILAFDGEFISGHTSLSSLQHEAARVFGWNSQDAMIVDDEHDHDERGTGVACSCAIALEIQQHLLFSAFHCRFTLDGEHCVHKDCPYSHIRLIGEDATRTPPHCILCDEFLGFPCPDCMEYATTADIEPSTVIHCPLLQNAGCYHLHHAHCAGKAKDALTAQVGCPSGCPQDKFPREAVVFDMPAPHLIVVWDGDKIDKVPIPVPEGHPDEGTLLRLTSDEIVGVVRDFLSSKEFSFPGLSLRIHSRDALMETVQFTRSTLVSICHASTHFYNTHHRFDIFPSLSTSLPQRPCSAGRDFHVDLHTSQTPIIACRFTHLEDLFCTMIDGKASSQVVLYAVKRQTATGPGDIQPGTVSKQQTYQADEAWHPGIPQTPRGMAAFLSSLYLLAHSVPRKGGAAEGRVLSMLYEITRFPPAVRTLGILFRNQIPGPEERAALSEALYHALKDFLSTSVRGPAPIITNPTRLFEAIRILLAHISTAAGCSQPSSGSGAPHPSPTLEEISLVCATSYKTLRDPILIDSQLVGRGFAALRKPGGELYRPSPTKPLPVIYEMTDDDLRQLKQVLSHSRALVTPNYRGKSTLVFRAENLGPLPSSPSPDLVYVGRDLLGAILSANKTDLTTHGPLDLKSVSVIAPQIVLDNEGLLAVFTGRACGSTRDVSFYRPTHGGDTEVDVNDVSHALEQVIDQRKAEDTWQVDSFGGVSAAPIRPPDEAIVLCLDLSQSMNKRSGVSHPAAGLGPAVSEDVLGYEQASFDLVDELVRDAAEQLVLDNAKDYLKRLHPSCRHAWQSYLDSEDKSDIDSEDESDIDTLASDLLEELGTLARREVLQISFEIEVDPNQAQKDEMIKLAHFASAAGVDQSTDLVDYFLELLYNLDNSEDVGVEPYDIPINLIDPKTGDILVDPVCPNNAPNNCVFVNLDTKDWFEAQATWPSGNLFSQFPTFSDIDEVEYAVAQWISACDILPGGTRDGNIPVGKGKMREEIANNDEIIVTLIHDGRSTVWHLSTNTTTRTLYRLANRATKAKYSRFTLRLISSKAPINDSASLSIGLTDLFNGGDIEVSSVFLHQRMLCEVTVQFDDNEMQKVLLPRYSPILALLGYLDRSKIDRMSDICLWHGLKDAGDGLRTGTVVRVQHNLARFGFGNICSFECSPWEWHSAGSQRKREKSKYLSRLDLLKELFNVFLNRASSFDTSVSLALGLVTFSDKASIKQELTPIFEYFRQQLDRVFAAGDTAVYDALDTARAMLTSYRSDLAPSHLRKRIIIVTDGADTNSKTPAREVCQALQRDGIIVDSVQVGDRSDSTLHAISVATGGYRFCPRTSLSDALSIFDLETMLSSAERPPRARMPPVLFDVTLNHYGRTQSFPVDVVTISEFPSRASHAKFLQSVKPAATLNPTANPHDDRTKRVMRELKALIADPHPQIDLYVNDEDISFFKVILEAPNDDDKCPYNGGTFLLTCDLPESYPRNPPEIRFVTFILHPNVSKQGKVCVAELGRLWSSEITLKQIFSQIYGLLLEPDLDNPLEIQASLKYYDDDGTYALAVANAVTEHASKTREEWWHELCNEGN